MDYGKPAIKMHESNRGKIELRSKVRLNSKRSLSLAYTPGVGAVCTEIKKHPAKSWTLTNRANSVAIVTDGTSILGLGDIGPEAGMPVMEGKAAIFKSFAGIDAYPLCIRTTDTEEIIKFVKYIEPSFGAVNLEDIAAPRCFDILERLEKELSIPVFHDDQDGTAIVVLAGLINACRLTGKVFKDLKIVINGAGAAGIATARLLIAQGAKEVYLADSQGLIYSGRTGLNRPKKEIAARTNRQRLRGDKSAALAGADVFIGVSKAGQLKPAHIKMMNQNAIVFALANPVPEIMPDIAAKAGAAIVGTGRSDFANQINNALVFPGIFRGLLDARIKTVTTKMKLKAALAIAYIAKPSKQRLLPGIMEKRIVPAIRKAVINAKK